MRRLVTLLLVAVPLICLAAGPLCPIVGTWAGEGSGSAYPPGTIIYPWQYWNGEVTDDGKTFHGEWNDETGNFGKFKGKIFWISLDTAVATGAWTWIHPSSVSKKAGDFKMTFKAYEKVCKGEWTTIYLSTSPKGYMWGEKVD